MSTAIVTIAIDIDLDRSIHKDKRSIARAVTAWINDPPTKLTRITSFENVAQMLAEGLNEVGIYVVDDITDAVRIKEIDLG